jgi:serine/threonine protein phosphatase PrpC
VTNLPAEQVPKPHAQVGYVMIVADGVGGMAAGEVASRTAITSLIDLAIQTPDWILGSSEENTTEVLRRMDERFGRLRNALENQSRAEPFVLDMGTTMTLAASLGEDLIIAHVGDSRAYLFTFGHLVPLTKDQTMAQLLAELGVIKPEEVKTHHSRHVLTSAITTTGENVKVELHHLRLADGDQLLLCSDGLTEMIDEAQIAHVLEKNKPADESCQTLVDLALEAGGKDNVTVVLARYQIPN